MGSHRGERISRKDLRAAYARLKADHEILLRQYREKERDFQEVFLRVLELEEPLPVPPSHQTTWGAANESMIETAEMPVLPPITVVQSEGLDEAKAFALRRRNGLLNHAAGDWS